MLKLAGKILDFTDDPDFINDRRKMAMIEGRLLPFEKHASLPNEAFALLIEGRTGLFRRYPIYSKTATAVSTAYFDETHGSLHPELQQATAVKLAEACKYFGLEVPASFAKIAEKSVPQFDRIVRASDLSDTEHATYFSKKAALQSLQRQYEDRFREMTNEERVERATTLCKIAKQLHVDMPIRVVDYAEKTTFGPLFKKAVDDRARFMEVSRGDKVAAFELRSMMKSASPKEAVSLMEAFDIKHRLADNYSNLVDPVRAVYGAQKMAFQAMGTPKDDIRAYTFQTIILQYEKDLRRTLTERGLSSLKADPDKFYRNASPAVKKMLDSMAANVATHMGDVDVKCTEEVKSVTDRAKEKNKAAPANKSNKEDQVHRDTAKGDKTLTRIGPAS